MQKYKSMSTEKYLGESALKNKPGKILNFKLKEGAITTDKLADQSVTTSKLVDSAVTTEKIADSSVTWIKLSKEIQSAIENGFGINLTTLTGKTYSNKILARLEVPVEYRTKGLVITYIHNNEWVTEQYQGLGKSTDDWQDDNLWSPISGIEEVFPISTKNVYDEFMQKSQEEINNELASHVTMTDLTMDLHFDDNTGDIYATTSDNSKFLDAEQDDNGDVLITIKG